METCLKTNFEMFLTMEWGFQVPKDKKERNIKKCKLTYNTKAIYSIISILPNAILRKVGKYENSKDLCKRLVTIMRTPYKEMLGPIGQMKLWIE